MNALRLTMGFAFIFSMGLPAFAVTKKDLRAAERKVTSLCIMEYPTELKGKKFKEIHDWVEKTEHGDKEEEFKKTKCYGAHEKWENVAGKQEGST